MESLDDDFSTTIELSQALPHRVYLPRDYNSSVAGFPLLLFLHGAGERGDELDQLPATGLPRLIEDGELDLPFLTVCPQCREGQWWNEQGLLALLDYLADRYRVDAERVYLTGLSMGGRGVWQLADAAPRRFAAIVPICAPYTFVTFRALTHLPIRMYHGAMDRVISIDESIRMVRVLRAAGCQVDFRVYPDADHDSWTETYRNPELYDWLLSQRRAG